MEQDVLMASIFVSNLLGQDNFTELLINMPDDYFELTGYAQISLWKMIYYQVSRGNCEIEFLTNLASEWLKLYKDMYPV